ncbi:MAG: FixH family protein [Parvibaculaceae bacterium]
MHFTRIVRAALAATLMLAAIQGSARAAASDYEFQLTQAEISQGDAAVIAVRLIDKRSGGPVSDAVIFATRLDMAPDGMETMTTKIEALPATEPGIYRFKANLSMEGGWRLSLAAKVQGEAETVQSELTLKALP